MTDREVRVGQSVVAVWFRDRHDQWRLYSTDDLDFDYEEGEDYPRDDAVGLSIAV